MIIWLLCFVAGLIRKSKCHWLNTTLKVTKATIYSFYLTSLQDTAHRSVTGTMTQKACEIRKIRVWSMTLSYQVVGKCPRRVWRICTIKGSCRAKTHYMMVLEADAFVDLAPRGTYSFEWDESKESFVYPVNTADDSDFESQRDLSFPAVKFGGTKFRDQHIQIHLGNDLIKLPRGAYEKVLEKIKAKTYVPSSSKKPKYRQITSDDPDDVNFDNTEITFPGKGSTTRMTKLFRPSISSKGVVNFLSSNSDYWVLGGGFLWMFKVIIDTKTEAKMYQITPYKESNVWSKLRSEVPAAGSKIARGVNRKASFSASPFY